MSQQGHPHAERKEFRQLISAEQARTLIDQFDLPQRTEAVPIAEAYGKVLAENVYADQSVPPFTRSLMDGYAVRAKNTFGTEETKSIRLKLVGQIEAGVVPEGVVGEGEAAEIATGALIPEGADAVVMVERTDLDGEDVLVRKAVAPGENIMNAGDDIVSGDLVLRSGARLTPREIGVLAAVGRTEATVYRSPIVGILSTGDELMEPGQALTPGKIYNSNAYALQAAIEEADGEPRNLGIVGDDWEAIESVLQQAARECDLILTSGSTSAGAGDIIYHILEEQGELIAHGIKIKPGKPTIIGRFDGKPFFGLPGNPASAYVVFSNLVAPLIRAAAGRDPHPRTGRLRARLAVSISSDGGRLEQKHVGLVRSDGRVRAYPIEKVSGAVTLLAQADGYIKIPEGTSHLEEGEEVEVVLLSEELDPPQLLFMGSYCPGVNLIIEHLPDLTVRSINVGSTGAVRAIRKGIADVIGIHLLDRSGEYNVPYLQTSGLTEIALIRGYRRINGLLLPKGNPADVSGIADIVDRNLRFINRARGSGTRTLLDTHLKSIAAERDLSLKQLTQRITGYEVEASSHSAVAAAIRNGVADVGLGLEAIAAMNGLDFVPIAKEIYDFLVRKDDLERDMILRIRKLLQDQGFQAELRKLPGFVPDPNSGQVIFQS